MMMRMKKAARWAAFDVDGQGPDQAFALIQDSTFSGELSP